MERRRYLIRFVYPDGNNFTSDAHFLVDVPANVSLAAVKKELTRCHEELDAEARYVESLEDIPESQLSAEDQKRMEIAEESNPYLDCPPQPDALMNYVCKCNEDWTFIRPQACFNLSQNLWA